MISFLFLTAATAVLCIQIGMWKCMRVAGIYMPKCCELPQFDISGLFCNFAALLLEEKALPKKELFLLGERGRGGGG